MTNNVEKSPPAPAEPRAAQPDELHDLRAFVREYGTSAGLAAVVVLAVAVGVGVYRSHTRSTREAASAQLGNARSLQDLESLLAKHAATPAAPLAMLKLAHGYFDGGNYDAAMAKYDEFKQKFPTHPLALAAELGRAHCQEAKGMTQAALDGFTAFIKEHPKDFLVPQAAFGKARCLEALGKSAEAKTVYEDFIAANPKSGWVPRAEELIEQLNRAMARPAGANTPAMPPPSSVTNLLIMPSAPVAAP